MNIATQLTLLYGEIIVGHILDAYEHEENTWFGMFESTVNPAGGELQQRLLDFIAFCKDWNERALSEHGADAIEFDRYEDLIKSGLWMIETPDGVREQIEDAPCFFYGGDASWLFRKPSRAGDYR